MQNYLPKFIRVVVILSTIGLIIEVYYFFLIRIIFTAIRPCIFFKKAINFALAFSILAYATTLVGRPAGRVIFGNKLGRKFWMFLSLSIFGQAILLVVLMTPIWITAVFLIAILRFVQGMGLGGDMGSSIVLSYEFAEKGKRIRYFTSFPRASAVLGMMLGVLGILLSERLESKIFLLTYGWRILMSVGTIAIIVSAYLRMRMLLH